MLNCFHQPSGRSAGDTNLDGGDEEAAVPTTPTISLKLPLLFSFVSLTAELG